MTAIILAGGKASRMNGQDKAFLKIYREPLISKQLRLLKKLFKEIIIVANLPEKYEAIKGVKVISDITPHQGPLGGIYSGLRASGSDYNFIIACDMPFINERLVKYMIKNIENFDVFIPKSKNKLHPLCGIYSKNCIPVIEQRLIRGRFKVSGIFAKLKAGFISEKKLRSFDDALLCLENINTPQDLENINRKRRSHVSRLL